MRVSKIWAAGWTACVLVIGMGGCKLTVSYPDQYAAEDGNGEPDSQSDGIINDDSVGPDNTPEDLTEDVEPVECDGPLKCEISMGPPGPCLRWACKSGLCSKVKLPEDTQCDDLDACSQDDRCVNGECLGAGSVVCSDDGNPCTDDFCDSESGECISVAVPGCGTCVPVGEPIPQDPDAKCCGTAMPIPTCVVDNENCGGQAGCSDFCCDFSQQYCSDIYDGFCSAWENECNSADCMLGGCLQLGQVGSSGSYCCDGTYQTIPWFGGEIPMSPICPEIMPDSVVCAPCPNGACDAWENECNCPSDCGQVTTVCFTDMDCDPGIRCLGGYCYLCSVEWCFSGQDEDCDGEVDEQPCQATTCPMDVGEYSSMPIQVILEHATQLEGSMLSTVGNVQAGPAECGSSCYASLSVVEKDMNSTLYPLLLAPSYVYSPVECKGPTSSSMTCSPAVDLGINHLVWGRLNLDGGSPALELEGYCKQ